MRKSTIILQCLCASLGAVFVWAAFAGKPSDPLGGLFVASLFFLFAALLGADVTTGPNKSRKAKLFFKGLAILFLLPIPAVGVYLIAGAISQGDWLNAALGAIEIAGFALLIACFAFEDSPIANRTLKRLGFAATQERSNEK